MGISLFVFCERHLSWPSEAFLDSPNLSNFTPKKTSVSSYVNPQKWVSLRTTRCRMRYSIILTCLYLSLLTSATGSSMDRHFVRLELKKVFNDLFRQPNFVNDEFTKSTCKRVYPQNRSIFSIPYLFRASNFRELNQVDFIFLPLNSGRKMRMSGKFFDSDTNFVLQNKACHEESFKFDWNL